MKKIIIKDIKHIKLLEFELPSKPGAYVLTGSNGSGKTTLMTALLRIGWYRAFQDHFYTGSSRVDKFSGEIIYKIGSKQVSYHHAGTRWPPTPRKNSTIFAEFGYPDVRFLPATGNRLYIHEQDINPTNFLAVEASLKNDLNLLLETTKFNNLRYVQTGSVRGPGSGSQRWKRAYVIKEGNNYYSEKNFSLGEILVLNTLLLIRDVRDGAMLLVDELEMALHPRVQIKLLKYLSEKAKEKNLTVILSTHSSSLVKCADKLIYLENKNDGNIKVKYNCYPALVLQDVAIEEDIQPDYVFMVEDDMAAMLLKEMIKYYYQLEPDKQIPVYKVLPIGGYQNVLEFSDHVSDYLFSSRIGQYIFPDADVKTSKDELSRKGNSRDTSEQRLYELFTKLENKTHFLPVTPELGVWNWITTNTTNIQVKLNSYYADSTFQLSDLIDTTNSNFSTDSDSDRKKAKRRMKYLCTLLEARVNESSKRIMQFLFGQFVLYYYSQTANQNSLKSIFGRISNTRGNR